jgi:hypothetical protein
VSTVVIEPRFCGPPRSGHGGYTAGLLAEVLGNPAEVTLLAPPPLDTPLELVAEGEGTALLRAGETTVASGREVATVDVVDGFPDGLGPLRWADAEAAGKRYAEVVPEHPFPTCFGCGPARSAGEALALRTGPVDSVPGLFAAPWVPSIEYAEPDGTLATRMIWAALDCPTGALFLARGGAAVLGRLAVDVRGPVSVGFRYIVAARATGDDGRKHHAEAVLATDMGNVQAVARATWIDVDPATFAEDIRKRGS